MDLYPKNTSSELDLQLFRTPTAEYRGAPFWSWNCKLDHAQLMRQIALLKAMGMGGFHIHSRTGLATEYLGDEFMELVRACVDKAREEGMLAWLYDEDRWPSGAAGGLVTSDPRFRAKHLLWTRTPYDGTRGTPVLISAAKASRSGNGTLLARYHIELRDGVLAHYHRLHDDEPSPADGVIWYAYLETALPSPWFNNQTYVDTLQKDAIKRFIAITHERYAQAVGQHFGTLIPAIFTDEPQFAHKQSFRFADDSHDLVIPWTDDLLATYQQAYGQDLAGHLPEIFWELPAGQVSVVRYRYHDHVCARFTEAFADTLGSWCDSHGLFLTGHMMEEPTLQSQTAALGEAMRAYRAFTLPGIDMLCDWREYTTAKQAQSAAHQYDRPGVLSELYGVTNWDFDFVGHKAQGDWQAALGVTVRVHHLAWVSMAGEAKRDYPASISYQSPWHYEYPLIEDYFARINTVLTRGQALVRVGVLHPIESYWLCFGPLAQTQVERDERERNFTDLTHWLLFGLIDFDFIAESLLPSLWSPSEDRRFHVGHSTYDVLLVPPVRTIRSSTLQRLERFQAAGGSVIFAGETPTLVDAVPSTRVQEFVQQCQQVAFTQTAILSALTPIRELSIQLSDGRPADSLLHQLRVDGDQRHLFICNTDRDYGRDGTEIALRGIWQVRMLDPFSGETYPLPSQVKQDTSIIEWDFPAHGSLLLSFAPGRNNVERAVKSVGWSEQELLTGPVPISLSEPNVLLLDQAAYRLNDEEWQPIEEVLRLDTILRQRLNWPLRMEALAQPWVDPTPTLPAHRLSLKFTVHTAIDVAEPSLALESVHTATITVDGSQVPAHITGWFVDEAIQTVPLPPLAAGTHDIILTMPYGHQTNVEWCYLLGDFGVEVHGRQAQIVAPVRKLAFGDWTRQGLPFYAGNVTYHCPFDADGQQLAIRTPRFKAPLLRVALNGQDVGRIAFAPFQLELEPLTAGRHTLDITAYGNRVNAFGCVHNADEHTTWFGPNAWRSEGDAWSYEYQLKPMGLLTAPRLLRQ